MSGMGNDGTLLNGAFFEASTGDGSPSAVRFDGVNDLIDLGSLDVNGTGFTLAVRFNAGSFPGTKHDPRLISKASSVQENSHVFMLGTFVWQRETEPTEDVRLRGRIRIGGVTRTVIASQGTLETDRWYHAAMTYDGRELRLYLDGVQVGGVTGLSGPVDAAPTVAVAIGGQPPGAGEHCFDGLIDDVRIMQRALTADEIMAIIDPITSVPEEILETPGRRGLNAVLYQNKPNPFNPATTLVFELPRHMQVKLSIFTVTGRLVSTLVDREMAAGRKQVVWNARDGHGRPVASGVYFYRLVAGGEAQTRKMVLLR
jgi:hypothetical protein